MSQDLKVFPAEIGVPALSLGEGPKSQYQIRDGCMPRIVVSVEVDGRVQFCLKIHHMGGGLFPRLEDQATVRQALEDALASLK